MSFTSLKAAVHSNVYRKVRTVVGIGSELRHQVNIKYRSDCSTSQARITPSSWFQWYSDRRVQSKYERRRLYSSSSSPSSSMFSSDFNFLDSAGSNNNNNQDDDDDEEDLTDRERKRKKGVEKLHQLEDRREILKTKKGRGWSDPWDIDTFMETGEDFKSMLEWAPEHVSRISQERVQIYNKDGRSIPSLTELAHDIPLPLPPPPNPAQHMKAYALYRKRYISKYMYARVVEQAEPKIGSILQLQDWDSKQDAIDILYEQVEFALRETEVIMSKQPNFGTLVERALEQYLRSVQKTIKEKATASSTDGATSTNPPSSDAATSAPTVMVSQELQKLEQRKRDETAVPIFIDCYNKDVDKADVAVPMILQPMKATVPLKPMVGRMVEEWELSACKTSKRIMLRQCTRSIAQCIVNAITGTSSAATTAIPAGSSNTILESATSRLEVSTTAPLAATSDETVVPESSSVDPVAPDTSNVAVAVPSSVVGLSSSPKSTRILVHGAQGVGKTAVMASIVASARQSGAIVLFIPDGNQMHQNGFYIEPDDKRSGIYNLPILSQNVCRHLIESHENDMNGMTVDANIIETYFTQAQIEKLKDYEKGTSINLVTLLNHGVDRTDLGPMCYSAAVHVLMQQTEKDFIMILDEGNCFYIPLGHYFHESYDYNVKRSIPYHQINLFEPMLNMMNITALKPNDDHYSPTIHSHEDEKNSSSDETTTKRSFLPTSIQRGAVIVCTTESHAIPRVVTETLIANAKIVSADALSSTTSAPLHVIEVPRLTTIEVQHMLSNYEATGVGFLRLDRGATVMNPNEVSYLQMVSGGIPQHLMNACMME